MFLFRSLAATMVSALVSFSPFDANLSPATAATKPMDARSMAASLHTAPRAASRNALDAERNVNVLYAWSGGLNGDYPFGDSVAFGGAGYGVTQNGGGTGCFRSGCGTIFKLAPPASGKTAWTHSVLHAFNGASGMWPNGIVADSAGVLYGTTYAGGGVCDCGTVFRLIPPGIGATTWRFSVLHTFTATGAEGQYPRAGLVIDKTGALYGTTGASGTVFKLTPPRTGGFTWAVEILHRFVGPDGGSPSSDLIIDGNGALYGTTSAGGSRGCDGFGCGTVFRLTPPAPGRTAWTESLLHVFTEDGGRYPNGVTADRFGALYVTTPEGGIGKCPFHRTCGSVVKLTAPASGIVSWNAQVVHLFTGYPNDGGYPNARVLVDSTGVLYGTTMWGGVQDEGTVFKLTPSSRNNGLWTQQILHSFAGGTDAAYPSSPLLDVGFRLYGLTGEGGLVSNACPSGCGAAFVIGK